MQSQPITKKDSGILTIDTDMKIVEDSDHTKAMQHYNDALQLPYIIVNFQKILDSLQLALNYWEKMSPKTSDIKNHLLNSYVYINQVHLSTLRATEDKDSQLFNQAKKSYSKAIKAAADLKYNDTMTRLHFNMASTAYHQVFKAPSSDKKNYFLDLSIDSLNKTLLIKPKNTYYLFMQSRNFDFKRKSYPSLSKEKFDCCDNLLSTLQTAITQFRLKNQYDPLDDLNFIFISMLQTIEYNLKIIKENIFNLKYTIDDLQNEYKESKNPKTREQLMRASI